MRLMREAEGISKRKKSQKLEVYLQIKVTVTIVSVAIVAGIKTGPTDSIGAHENIQAMHGRIPLLLIMKRIAVRELIAKHVELQDEHKFPRFAARWHLEQRYCLDLQTERAFGEIRVQSAVVLKLR